MTSQEYFNQVFELGEKVDASRRKSSSDPHLLCNINAKKIARMLELSQEINELVDKRTELKLKYGWSKAYKGQFSFKQGRYALTNLISVVRYSDNEIINIILKIIG